MVSNKGFTGIAFLLFVATIAGAQSPGRLEAEIWKAIDVTGGRKVTDASLVLKDTFPGIEQSPKLEIKVSSKSGLALIEKALHDIQTNPPREGGGFTGIYPVAQLHLKIDGESVVVGVYQSCYGIEKREKSETAFCTFHSASLTAVLNAILIAKHHAPLSDAHREALTGLLLIRRRTDSITKQIRDVPEFQD